VSETFSASRERLQALARARRQGRPLRAGGRDGVSHDDAAPAPELGQALSAAVRGEVRFDAAYRAVYTTDSSNYRQAPIGVVCPLDAKDVAATLAICREHGAPVTLRGCGTSLAGQTTNATVIVDVSRHMREILEVDPQRRLARVQPGVIRDQLAKPLESEHGLSFPPDTSTHAYATFGGMIGNNSCGAHSVMTGRTSDNVVSMNVVLHDGTQLTVGATPDDELERLCAKTDREGQIYAALRALRDREADRIRARFPDIPRRVSGFNLDELLPEKGFQVARALVGTEGTCAVVTEATVKLTPWPRTRALLILGYESIFHAADHVPDVMETGPMACEAIDDVLVNDMREQGMEADKLPLVPDGRGWLIAEYGADTREEADAKATAARKKLAGDCVDTHMYDDPQDEEDLWEVREGGLGATAYLPGGADHYEGWEDSAVPPERLGSYLRAFQKLLDRHEYDTSLYGHFGQGLVHCRINFDLRSAGGIQKWRHFLEEAADLVIEHGGSLSGEHGDGQSRAWALEKMYGPELVAAFGEFRRIWDPEGGLNPGKVIDPFEPTQNLKLGTDYNPPKLDTRFNFPDDGGHFAHAALRCVGAGKCRDSSSGTMCPSYQVTLDEEHTTRGRARVLFEMVRGEVITDGWRSKEVHEALDLCLSCKGCKGDCPVNVDMATYKAEFLHHHYKRRLRPLPAYSMGLIMLWARLASKAPRLVNALTHAPGLKSLIKLTGGLTPHRELPRFAREPFGEWFARHTPRHPTGTPVVLWADTFNTYLHAEVAKAAVFALEDAGCRVMVPDGSVCCGRPLYDYGMLAMAERLLLRDLEVLRPHIRAGVPVVGLEPSCVAAFRDELPALLSFDEDARRLGLQTLTLPEFLLDHLTGYEPPKLHRKAIVHLHCHHRAVLGSDQELELLKRMGMDVEAPDFGCCGLAGSFGFERDKYDLSMKIGEQRLLPAVREAPADTLIVGDGFSCKTQIEQATSRRALHVAQVLKLAAEHGPDGPAGDRPERHYPD
jgi:FAD/FMN-containing dehydrogenase/Fe-S oxidoreductase